MIELTALWGIVLVVLALVGVAALVLIAVSGSRLGPAWRVLRDPAAAS
jgi:ABC-type branched-subunit amino acid transport system permease subunit